MLGFAGVGSSTIVARALAGPKALSAVQKEKLLGPRPTPRWYWRWVDWRLGEGYAKGRKLQPGFRPAGTPRRIPNWAWERLHFFLLARDQQPGLAGNRRKHGRPPATTTTGTTTSAASTTTTTGTTTTGTTTTTPTGGETYEQAISYTQTRPSFTPSRTVNVSNASQLQAALSNLQPGDLVQATGSFTVNGTTVIRNQLSSPAELDLSGVQLRLLGGPEQPGRLGRTTPRTSTFSAAMPAQPTPAAKASSSTGRNTSCGGASRSTTPAAPASPPGRSTGPSTTTTSRERSRRSARTSPGTRTARTSVAPASTAPTSGTAPRPATSPTTGSRSTPTTFPPAPASRSATTNPPLRRPATSST